MKIEITVPCYNESKIIEKNINILQNYCRQKIDNDWQIIIADNGLTDNTYEIAKRLAKESDQLKVIHYKQKGRGRTLRKIWSNSKADFLIYMDADLSTNLEALPKLIKELKNNDLVMASRYLPESNTQRELWRLIISKIYNFLIQKILKINITDAQCGFKGLNQKVAKNILPLCTDKYWFFDTELIYYCLKKNLQVKEIPVHWQAHTRSSVKIIKDSLIYIYSVIKFKIKNA